MTAAFPIVAVEVAFTTAPLALVPTWTDVSSFVEWNDSMSVKRGRTYETEQVQPSSATLTVNNADGRFTAGNAASPYYPNVKPNRRMRIRTLGVPLTLLNPGFEVNATGWVGNQAAIARSTAQAHSGAASGLVTPSGVAATSSLDQTSAGSVAPVTPGRVYRMTAWVYSPLGYDQVGLEILWRNSVPATVGTVTGSTQVVPAGQWTPFDLNGVAATGAVAALLRIRMPGSPAASDLLYVDDVGFAEGGVVPLFDGYVDAWPSQWDNGVWAKATITATDRLKLLSRRQLRSMLEEEILGTLDPLAYFPLTETGEASAASDVSVHQQRQAIQRPVGSGAGTIAFGSGPVVVDGLPSAVFTRTASDNGKSLYSRFTAATVAGFSVSMWAAFPDELQALWRLNTPTSAETNATLTYTAVGNAFLGTKDRTLRFQMHETQLGARADTAPMPQLTDGQMHHIAVTSTNTSGATWEARVYVDGVLVAGPTIMEPSSGTFGSIGEFWFGGSNGLATNATLAHVALFDYALNTTQIQLLMDGSRYYPNDLAGTRIERILGYAGIVTTNLDPGTLTLGRQVTTGRTVDAACGQVAATEGGVFFIAADGTPTFHDREHRSASINMEPNPSFEVDTTHWVSVDGTLVRVTTQKHSGIASGQITITDLTGTPVVRTATASLILGVVGGRWYHASYWDRLSTAGTRSASIKPIFMRTDNSITLNPTVVATASVQGVWTYRSALFQAPADAVKIQTTIGYDLGDVALSDVHQLDTVELYTPAFVLIADQLQGDLQFSTDESLIRNDVTVSRIDGQQYQRADAISVDDYGELDYSEDVLLTNDRDTSDRLEYLLRRYAQPQPRASSLSVDLVTKTVAERVTLVPALLAADIGQRFAVTGLPTGAPSATAALDIDGIEHNISPNGWVVKLDTSPPPSMFIPRAFFKLDDTVLGKLDAGNFLGA